MTHAQLLSILCRPVLDERRYRRLFWEAILVGAVLFIAVALSNAYLVFVIAELSFFCVAVAGLVPLTSRLGQLPLGAAAFWTVGAYTSAHVAMIMPAYSALGIAAGGVAGGLVAVTLAPAFRRTAGAAFSLGTLVLGIVVEHIVREIPAVTGGSAGLEGIPTLAFGQSFEIRVAAGVAVAILMFSLMRLARLDVSHVGRMLAFSHQEPEVSSTLGIDSERMRGIGFVIAGASCGIGGAGTALLTNYLGPSTTGFEQSVTLLAAAIVAGTFSPVAVLGGGLLVMFLGDAASGLWAWRVAIVGAGLFVVQRFFPGGIGEAISRRLDGVAFALSATTVESDVARTIGDNGIQADDVSVFLQSHESAFNRGHGMTPILRHVQFGLSGGSRYGLQGPNGSGKTTLLNVLSGLHKYTGTLRFKVGGVPRDYSGGAAARRGYGCLKAPDAFRIGVRRTFQTPVLLRSCAVIENIALGVDADRQCGVLKILLGFDRSGPTVDVIDDLDLSPLISDEELFERAQKVEAPARRAAELLRATARRHFLLLLDEPSSGISDTNAFVSHLQRLLNQASIVLIAEHNEDVLRMVSEDTLMVDAGIVSYRSGGGLRDVGASTSA